MVTSVRIMSSCFYCKLFVWLFLCGGLPAVLFRIIAAIASLVLGGPRWSRQHLIIAKYLLCPIDKTIVFKGHINVWCIESLFKPFQIIMLLIIWLTMIVSMVISCIITCGEMHEYYLRLVRNTSMGIYLEYSLMVINESEYDDKAQFDKRFTEIMKTTKQWPYKYDPNDFKDVEMQ